MSKQDLYFSVDVESDGPIPGRNSMLNFGAAVFSEATGEEVLATFNVNIETLEEASQDPGTMAWWKTQPEAWARIREGIVPPSEAMARWEAFVDEQCAKQNARPVCVCYPAGYDWTFLYWYMMVFRERSRFGFSGVIDVKTFAFAHPRVVHNPRIHGYRDVKKGNFPKEWLSPEQHTHVGVDDATEQGIMFMRMLRSA